MKTILLCGGAGVRFENIYPKPMNYVLGFPLIQHVLDGLKHVLSNLTIFYYYELEHYGFKELLINTYPDIQFEFIKINFRTRGPVETCYVGLKKLQIPDSEQILFLDNDNIYTGLNSLDELPSDNFLITNKNPTGLSHYSFVKFDAENRITDIEERKMISEYICMGGYGFKNYQTCLEYLQQVMECVEDEPFLSYVFKKMLLNNEEIKSYSLPLSYSLGTPNDVILNMEKIKFKKLRAVFDLDNTILSYPTQYKNYTTVKTLEHIKQLILFLKSKGHEIIIYTARRTVTCNHNLGKVIKSIGRTTLETLDNLEIPYDELHFGKPYGDLYIDDKAFNTFDKNLSEQIGFFDHLLSLQEYQSNKYNTVRRINKTTIMKEGLSLEGEIWFYSCIQQSTISQYFPKLMTIENVNRILLEFIDGTLFSKIYNEGLLQDFLLLKLLHTTQMIHSVKFDDGVSVSQQDLELHYMEKFEQRSKRHQDYPFESFHQVYESIKQFMTSYLAKTTPMVDIIHGDLWFSNILFIKGGFKFFDMRGKIHNKLTTKGDRLYDYAKLYQSILGLDYILEFNEPIPQNIFEKADKLFWTCLMDQKILDPDQKKDVIKLTGYLIYNTFHAYEENCDMHKKTLIWKLVENIYLYN